MKYNEGLLQAICAEYVTKVLKLPHFFVNMYAFYEGGNNKSTNELDFVYIDKYGYTIEKEIKTAWNDTLDDFRLKIEKHQLLSSGDESCPNRFYIVIPADTILRYEDIPEYCGIMEVTTDKYGEHKLKTIRKAPLIHDKKKYKPEDFFQKVFYQLSKFQNIWFGEKKKEFKDKLKKEGLLEPKTKKISSSQGRAKPRRRKTTSTSRRRRSTKRR